MTELPKQLFVLGAGILFVLCFFTIYTQRTQYTELDSLKKHAMQLGSAHAQTELIRNSALRFYTANHGWGITSVPGITNRTLEECIIQHASTQVLVTYSDTPTPADEAVYFEQLSRHPELTPDFAEGFNQVMVAAMLTNPREHCLSISPEALAH